MARKIQLRRDTAAAWSASNPTLAQGEVGIDLTSNKIKIGNGSTAWNNLAYFDDNVTDFSAVSTNIVPDVDNTRDLGTPDKQWRHVYTAGGSIYLDDVKLTNVNGKFVATKVINPGTVNEAPHPTESDATSNITDRLVSGNAEVVLENNGTLNVPYPSQDSFRIRLNSENFVPRQDKATLTLTGDAWDFYGAFASSQNGERQLAADNGPLPSLTNPGYEDGDTFEIDSTAHGIPGYVLTVALSDVVQAGPAGWTANLAFSPPPDYPSTVNSQGAIKVTSNNNSWIFGTDGDLTLPAGGDILDSTGVSVLGSGGGDTGDWAFTGNVAYNGNSLDQGLYVAPGGEGVSYIYVPGNSESDTVPIQIGNTSSSGQISVAAYNKQWLFNAAGDLTLPAGGDIVDSTGASVLGSGGLPTVTVPGEIGTVYKGLQVSYGMVHSNSNNNELNVNKIVIHKPAVTTTTIHPTSSQDDFEVTGLGSSDVLAMFVIFGDTNGPKPLSELQTFAQAVIDNVILDGGVEGDYNTVELMKTAFYTNYPILATGGLDLDFEFFEPFANATTGVTTVRQGNGAVFEIGDNGLGSYTASGIQNAGTNYLTGHKILVLGTALGGVTPDNDCVITIDSISEGGLIFQWSVSGTAAGTVSALYAPVTGTNYQVGNGATFSGIGKNNDGSLYANFNSQGTGYVTGDVLTLPGSDLQSGVTPLNDITLTVTSSDAGDGRIYGLTVTGVFPNIWRSNNISDGGNDQYDTANYINTSLASQISYNGGNTVADGTAEFGAGSSYTFVYDTGIFGLLVTGNQSTSISTSGNSGADGDSTTEAGNLYGPNTVSQTFDSAVTHINLIGDPYAGPIVSFTHSDNGNEVDILIPDSGVGALEDIYLGTEAVFGDIRDQDAQIIAPATRPWADLPSYQAYELILQYTPPGGVLPPTNNIVPAANSARNAYLTWQEALAEFGPARGVGITRDGNNGIYNPYRDDGWDQDVSPSGTLWNIDGWADLSDVESRTYDNLYATFGSGGLGNKIVGAECVMYLPDNGKYYAVKFSAWTQNNNGGGFAYTRRELDLTSLTEGIRFADGTRLKSAEGLGRVKLESPGARRIEEVHGYKSVSVTAREVITITTTASRSVTNESGIWVDTASTTIDNVYSDPQTYQVVDGAPKQFSLDNITWYNATGGYSFIGNETVLFIDTPVTYNQGDTIYFRYTGGGTPTIWWDKNELPGGGGNFRGAIIDYHAYTGSGTIIGTIHIVDDDGEENITHTEVSSGGTSNEYDDLWLVTTEGQIKYRRIDGSGRTLKVQWTAKVFYGSELYD